MYLKPFSNTLMLKKHHLLTNKSFPRNILYEGGGEDEGGKGDAVGDQDDWEVPSATRANNGQLSSREFCIIVVPNSNSTLIKVQFIQFCSSKINVYPV